MLRDRLTAALKDAMKSKDKVRLSTLRLILAAVKERDIEAHAQDRCDGASEEEILAVLSKMVKQREESAKTYEDAGRVAMAETERAEIEVVREFMPRQLTDAEIATAVDSVVKEVEATNLKDMGKCMSALKSKYAGEMDFGRAGAMVKKTLG
ncbi:MAG: GatB/YqeY domain-containing protein [Pseudomonadota bacterium]